MDDVPLERSLRCKQYIDKKILKFSKLLESLFCFDYHLLAMALLNIDKGRKYLNLILIYHLQSFICFLEPEIRLVPTVPDPSTKVDQQLLTNKESLNTVGKALVY